MQVGLLIATMKFGKRSFVTLLPYFLNILTFLSWERLSFALKLFFKNDHTWMNYPLVLSDLKTFDFQLLLIRDNNTNFEVVMSNLQEWVQGE